MKITTEIELPELPEGWQLLDNQMHTVKEMFGRFDLIRICLQAFPAWGDSFRPYKDESHHTKYFVAIPRPRTVAEVMQDKPVGTCFQLRDDAVVRMMLKAGWYIHSNMLVLSSSRAEFAQGIEKLQNPESDILWIKEPEQ